MDLEITLEEHLNIFTNNQYKELLQNGTSNPNSLNNIPIVYIVSSDAKYKWLISELYSDDPYMAFGLSYIDNKLDVGRIDLNFLIKIEETTKGLLNELSFNTEYKLAVFKYVAEKIGYLVIREQGYHREFQQAVNYYGI